MSNREIIEWKVRIKVSKLTTEQKVKVYDSIEEYCDIFSPFDESGTCPQVTVHSKVHDELPFFAYPYMIRGSKNQ